MLQVGDGRDAANVRLAVLALLLFAFAEVVTGRLDVEAGIGWDGVHYVRALEGRLAEAAHTVLTRPAVILLNVPAYRLLGDAAAAFRVMNYVYAFLLAIVVCRLFDRYAADSAGKVPLVASFFLSIAVVKMFAFYPTLVDLGALAVISAATLSIVEDRPAWVVALLCVAAALSREFGMCVVAFAVVRHLRLRRSVRTALLTYGPAAAAFIAIRVAIATYRPGEIESDLWNVMQLSQYIGDPFYDLITIYFLLTVFGGVSLAVAVGGRRVWALLRAEPEWCTFLVLTVLVTARTHDIWRYQMFLAPLAAVLFARAWDATPVERRRALGVAVLAATLLTQRPWQAVDEFIYFRDWFPLYKGLGLLPEDLPVELWPLWAWRPVLVAVLAAMLVLVRRPIPAAAWRRAAMAAAVVVAALGVAAWTMGLRPALRPPSVGPREATVRWAAQVNDATRRELEHLYRIDAYRMEGDRTWRYRFTGASRIDDLLRDPRVEDTHYFEVFDWRWRYTYYLELLAPTRVSLELRHLPISRLE
jgi:hypothetical protein